MGKVKIKLTASEYLAFARLIPVIPGDMFECPVSQSAQRDGLRSIMKKMQAHLIDGLKKDMALNMNTHESWAIYTITHDLPRDLLDTYQNNILDKIIRSIHQQLS